MSKVLLASLMLFSSTLYAQSWVQKADAIVGRHHPISFALDGKGYAVTGTLSNGQPTNDVYEYDPGTDTWTTLSSFPGAARSFGIGTTANGIAYLGFGATNTQRLNDFWSYDPATGSWTQLSNCACSGRQHPAMISIGNRIYVGLGNDNSGNLKDWWMYDITADSWSQIADLPGLARHHPFMFNAGGEVFAGLGHGDSNPNLQVYNDWYKLDTASNTWITMNPFPGEGRVAGQQFSMNEFGFVISGDGSDHNFMPTGEMWQYTPSTDSWMELTPHPGISRWAPGSFVINNVVYFFGGQNRSTNAFPSDLWSFNLEPLSVAATAENLSITSVYPNPTNGTIYWKSDENITEVKLYNTMGQLVLTNLAKSQSIETNELNSGLYLVQFYDQSRLIKTSKVLIQH